MTTAFALLKTIHTMAIMFLVHGISIPRWATRMVLSVHFHVYGLHDSCAEKVIVTAGTGNLFGCQKWRYIWRYTILIRGIRWVICLKCL